MPQARVHVARRTGFGEIIFGHEGDTSPVTGGDFFGCRFIHHVAIGHLQRSGVGEVEFVLTATCFTFGKLHRNSGSF